MPKPPKETPEKFGPVNPKGVTVQYPHLVPGTLLWKKSGNPPGGYPGQLLGGTPSEKPGKGEPLGGTPRTGTNVKKGKPSFKPVPTTDEDMSMKDEQFSPAATKSQPMNMKRPFAGNPKKGKPVPSGSDAASEGKKTPKEAPQMKGEAEDANNKLKGAFAKGLKKEFKAGNTPTEEKKERKAEEKKAITKGKKSAPFAGNQAPPFGRKAEKEDCSTKAKDCSGGRMKNAGAAGGGSTTGKKKEVPGSKINVPGITGDAGGSPTPKSNRNPKGSKLEEKVSMDQIARDAAHTPSAQPTSSVMNPSRREPAGSANPFSSLPGVLPTTVPHSPTKKR